MSSLDHEGRLGVLGGEAGGRPAGPVLGGPGEVGDGAVEVVRIVGYVDALPAQPAAPRLRLVDLGIVDDRVEAGEHAFVVEEAGIVGRDRAGIDARVGVPEQGRRVAGLASEERDVGEAGVERCAVEDRTVILRVHAGVERRPARPARRGVRPVVREQHALVDQRVECRGLDHRVADARQGVAAPLVDGDEQDVADGSHDGDTVSLPRDDRS